MSVARRRWWGWLGASLFLWALAPAAWAQVSVVIDGDTAYATISLEGNGTTYEADVTIVFDTPLNLSAQSLNLTAELVDPDQIQERLPPIQCGLTLLGPPCVTVDPAFPVNFHYFGDHSSASWFVPLTTPARTSRPWSMSTTISVSLG